jgi:hypothetical protein
MTQVDALRTQMLRAVDDAVAAGTLEDGVARRLRRLGSKPRTLPSEPTAKKVGRYHRKASRALERACGLLAE